MNSFLQLQEEETRYFVEHYQDEVRANVEAQLRTLNFISDVLEHFFPRLSDTMSVLAGREVVHPSDASFLTVDELDLRRFDSPTGPGENMDGEIIR